MSQNNYLFDESSISLKVASRLVREGKIKGKLFVHNATIQNIEAKATTGNFSGVSGLDDLRKACLEKNYTLEYTNTRTEYKDVNQINREFARLNKATIVTCNPIMAKMAESLGIEIICESPFPILDLKKIFTEGVMSLHLKEDIPIRVKRGHPGKWQFEKISDHKLNREEIEAVLAQIMEETYSSLGEEAFIEVEETGVTIVQLKDYRVVVTRPPFSDGLEITITKPMIKRSLQDYNLPKQVLNRLEEQAEGLLIAGPPGMGKSTLAQALAEYYHSLGKVVKTIESPRDLNLPPDITQYSKRFAKDNELHDVLLLSRPDYTIFDEMRTGFDFKLFIDLRFSGIGMVGVLHGTNPMDSIRRIAQNVDIGVLPSIVDTLIFMNEGVVSQIYTIEMTVRVPSGLKRADLSRPIVIVKDLFTGKAVYELYVFGERTFFVPLNGHEKKTSDNKYLDLFSHLLSKYLNSYEIKYDDDTLKIKIYSDEFQTYLKKCQKKIVKKAKKLNLKVEAIPI